MSTLDTVITELQTAKTNIGQAIVAKGGTVLLNDGFSDYAADIATIPINVSKKDVNFYDYDGTLVKSYTIAEAQALTALPAPPDHSADTTPLTFQEWNYTLAEVNATASPIDIGATYITTDGKTHFHVTVTNQSGLSLPLYYNKSDTSTLTIDWGDGNVETDIGSGNLAKTHNYLTTGNYIIKMWISSGSGTYGFGNGTNTTALMLSTSSLTRAFIGANVIEIGAYGLFNSYSLMSITLTNAITVLKVDALRSCISLTSIILPNALINMETEAIGGCTALTSLTIPSSVTNMANYVFTLNRGIKVYTFRATVPPIVATPLFGTNVNSICRIRVPAASLSAYQTATNWSTYANYMEGY